MFVHVWSLSVVTLLISSVKGDLQFLLHLIAVHLSGINPSLLTFPSPGTPLTIKMTAEANQERTFIMIKPDGVQRGLVGEILKRFEQKGFKLVAMKFMHVSYNIESFNGLIFRRSLWCSGILASSSHFCILIAIPVQGIDLSHNEF